MASDWSRPDMIEHTEGVGRGGKDGRVEIVQRTERKRRTERKWEGLVKQERSLNYQKEELEKRRVQSDRK